LVVVSGEFGRTPEVNAAAGHDHGPQVFSMEDLTATISDRLGIDPDKEHHTSTKRPV